MLSKIMVSNCQREILFEMIPLECVFALQIVFPSRITLINKGLSTYQFWTTH